MVQFIQDTECIGDSLVKINSNFSALRTNVQSLITTKFDKAGGEVTGDILLPDDPTQPRHAATKQYVDALKSNAFVSFQGKANNNTLCTILESTNVLNVRKIGNPGLYKVTFVTPFLYKGSSGSCVVREDNDAMGYFICGSGYKPSTVNLASGRTVENYDNNTLIGAIDIQTFNLGANPNGTTYKDVDTISITFF